MSDREEIRTQLELAGIDFLLAQFVDIHGTAKVKMVPRSALDDMIDTGAGFAGAAVWGVGQGPSSHDMLARIDLDTFTPLPWKPNTARFAADLFVDGESYPFCARTNLKRVLAEAKQLGY
ncbi:MAG: glutamine synthetase beta-grasp domain-containing protein, partial [Planctomycetaceae bacterium]|nr:glutamine synthetase beta-grasp domain-containing protein [Planctomycetaceae bacterium]